MPDFKSLIDKAKELVGKHPARYTAGSRRARTSPTRRPAESTTTRSTRPGTRPKATWKTKTPSKPRPAHDFGSRARHLNRRADQAIGQHRGRRAPGEARPRMLNHSQNHTRSGYPHM